MRRKSCNFECNIMVNYLSCLYSRQQFQWSILPFHWECKWPSAVLPHLVSHMTSLLYCTSAPPQYENLLKQRTLQNGSKLPLIFFFIILNQFINILSLLIHVDVFYPKKSSHVTTHWGGSSVFGLGWSSYCESDLPVCSAHGEWPPWRSSSNLRGTCKTYRVTAMNTNIIQEHFPSSHFSAFCSVYHVLQVDKNHIRIPQVVDESDLLKYHTYLYIQ